MSIRSLFMFVPSLFFMSSVYAVDLSCSLTNVWREEALRSWREGQVLEARNSAFRYLELRRREEIAPSDKYDAEMQQLFDTTNKEVIHALPDQHEAPPARVSAPIQITAKKKLSKRQRYDKQPVREADRAKSAKKFIERAQSAEANGQLEVAVKFYKLAHTLDPNSSEIATKLRELQKEVN